jgi:hypothetical protein
MYLKQVGIESHIADLSQEMNIFGKNLKTFMKPVGF